MQDNIMVSVYLITYNHKDFIKKALDGVVKQKTNFKYEVIIYDDCSTDGTREIVQEYINKYPELFIPILPTENRVSKEGFHGINMDMYSKCKGKYLAYCEGDDYWTDENKLQIQVDYMESHPDFSGCFHKSLRKNVLKNEDIGFMPQKEQLMGKSEFDLADVQKGYFIETVSVMYRFDIYKKELIETFPEKIINGDSFLINFFTIHGKIGYIDRLMSVKNIGEQGIWNSKKNSVDKKNVKYAYEIVNLPVQINRLFEKYNIGIKYADSPQWAAKRVVNSAFNIKRYDVIEKLSENFPDIMKEIINSEDNHIKLERKIKKYKNLTKIFVITSILLSIIVLFLLVRGLL